MITTARLLILSLFVYRVANFAGATVNFAPALIEEPGQTSGFAPVPFMGLF